MNRREMNRWLSSFSKNTNLFILKKKGLILVKFLNNVEKKEYYAHIYNLNGDFYKREHKNKFPSSWSR